MKNQKGFSAVEGLLILVIVGLLGFTGWYVWDAKKKADKSLEGATKSQLVKTPKETSADEEPGISKKSCTPFVDENITFHCPEGWTAETRSNYEEWVFITSPDFKEPTGDGIGPSAESGYSFEVYVHKPKAFEDTFEEILQSAVKAEETLGSGSHKIITIDGNKAVWSDTKTHGTYLYATTISNNKLFYFRLRAVNEDVPEVSQLFTSILNSVRFK